MPSSGGDGEPLSVRDVVNTRTAFDPNRPRSKSAGRATTRSRDIVQEVYDRMGVSRGDEAAFDDDPFKSNEQEYQRSATPGRGRGGEHSPDPADKFSRRYRAAAALSSPRTSNDRGRAEQQDGESARRCRSLSRGRAVAGRWPPAQNSSEQQTFPQPVATFLPRKTEESPAAAAAAAPLSPKSSRKHTYSRSESQEEVNSESDSSSPKEETTTATSVPSVKDRINVYAGRNSSRNFPQKKPSNYQTYASQKRPAPIDIYQDVRKQESPPKVQESASGEVPSPPPAPSAVPPSPAAAAAADAAFAYVRGGNSSRSVKSAGPLRTTPRGSTNGIAGTYLGAIKSPNSSTNKKLSQQQTTSAPLTEISASDPAGDGHSVAASSVSADEFNFSSPVMSRSVGGSSTKKPSWAERNKPQVSPPSRNTNGTSQYNNNNSSGSRQQPSTPSAAEIEKMVEQRVKARVSVVEMRMEEQMLRLERRVEEKLNARIGMLDEKIDKMNSMLAMLLSRELGASENERRENEI